MANVHFSNESGSAVSLVDSCDPRHPDRVREALRRDPNAIVTDAPDEKFKLGYGSVMALVINRMIGSGIFVNAGSMLISTQSTGVTLIFWAAGISYAVSGIIVYIEYGLSVPRRAINDDDITDLRKVMTDHDVTVLQRRLSGRKLAIPRSGGDLNYLSYVYRFLAYAKNTIMFVPSVYGMCFVIFGTMAGNAMNCALRFIRAANTDPGYRVDNAQVRAVAISISIGACFIHTLSRRGGIMLNNLFALVKILILVLIITITIAYHCGAFPKIGPEVAAPYNDVPSRNLTLDANFDTQHSFAKASHVAFDYSSAFLDVIFTFSGFDQANYVLGEIRNPRKTFPVGLNLAVALVSLLYLAVNICYWTVIPTNIILDYKENVAEVFFVLTIGSLSDHPQRLGRRVASAFMGVSALGNVIVMTYTATRVKQEIAKEAILPFPKFFASNHDLSIGRFLKWTIGSNKIASSRWLSAENFQEKTPVGATVLHLITCVVLIFGTWTLPPDQAYLLLVGISSYLMTAFFGILLSVGILYLRLRPSVRWNEKSPRVSSKVSITAAATFLILNLFPVVAKWFKPPVQKIGVLKWYLVPTVSWATLGFGALWWLVIFMRHRIKDRRTNQVLTIEKQPEYVEEPIGSGQLVQTHETTFISRKGKGDAKADLEALGFRSDSAKHEPDARMAQLGFDAGD